MGWNDKQNRDCSSHSASSYLENRLTFENQTWYTYKRVTLEHSDTIFNIILYYYIMLSEEASQTQLYYNSH